MKKCLYFLLFVAAATTAFSQDDIRTNILSYADSTELIIRNGRKLIVDKTLSGQHKEALAALNYMKENMDRRYVVLYPVEELLFSLATRNFPLFLYNARNFNTLLEGKTRAVMNESIVPEMQDYLNNEMSFITEDLDNYRIDEKDRELIRIYIRYFMNDDVTDLNKTIKTYLKMYPETGYSYFLNEIKKLTTTARMNFVMGYGNEFLNGQIAETFSNRLHIMNLEIDGFINQLYLSIFIGGSISPVYSNIDLPVKDKDLIHGKEEKIFSLKYGIKAGRIVYTNQKLNLYPYISLGGYEMNSESSDFADNDSSNPKNNLTGSFYAGFGAASDIVLKKWESKSIYSPPGSLFLRLQTGYDRFLSQKEHTNGYDYYFMVSLGFGLGSFY
jgi:hypothetical protein